MTNICWVEQWRKMLVTRVGEIGMTYGMVHRMKILLGKTEANVDGCKRDCPHRGKYQETYPWDIDQAKQMSLT